MGDRDLSLSYLTDREFEQFNFFTRAYVDAIEERGRREARVMLPTLDGLLSFVNANMASVEQNSDRDSQQQVQSQQGQEQSIVHQEDPPLGQNQLNEQTGQRKQNKTFEPVPSTSTVYEQTYATQLENSNIPQLENQIVQTGQQLNKPSEAVLSASTTYQQAYVTPLGSSDTFQLNNQTGQQQKSSDPAPSTSGTYQQQRFTPDDNLNSFQLENQNGHSGQQSNESSEPAPSTSGTYKQKEQTSHAAQQHPEPPTPSEKKCVDKHRVRDTKRERETPCSSSLSKTNKKSKTQSTNSTVVETPEANERFLEFALHKVSQHMEPLKELEHERLAYHRLGFSRATTQHGGPGLLNSCTAVRNTRAEERERIGAATAQDPMKYGHRLPYQQWIPVFAPGDKITEHFYNLNKATTVALQASGLLSKGDQLLLPEQAREGAKLAEKESYLIHAETFIRANWDIAELPRYTLSQGDFYKKLALARSFPRETYEAHLLQPKLKATRTTIIQMQLRLPILQKRILDYIAYFERTAAAEVLNANRTHYSWREILVEKSGGPKRKSYHPFNENEFDSNRDHDQYKTLRKVITNEVDQLHEEFKKM
ncbi:hypothetical protein QAD02_021352 [Eretmocerus hayati]|uniref:Uncharacterized protein n=1 Tax=Eretmocerus hayati TaxID=131215 RepID=A0ACC2PQG9_9HYME|nr:hypothetical protein QAD02_021352 [Eretmocerus hayati]